MRDDFLASAISRMATAAFSCFCQSREIRLAVLFGSCAAGRHRENSDLDLAVLLAGHSFLRTDLARGEQKRRLVHDLTVFFQTSRVDLVLLNQASPLLKLEVARNGKVAYEQNPGEFAAFVSLAVRQQTDDRLFTRLHRAYLKG